MELKLGKMTNKELAEWFGISESSFRAMKQKKLEELKCFAKFYERGGKICITKIIEPIYNKQKQRTLRKVVDLLDTTWNKNGLDTCAHVGAQICIKLSKEGIDRKESTIVNYTRQGRNELYGQPFMGEGSLGSCEYLWCKKDLETGQLDFLTEEEQKIKAEIQKKYFGDATEKQIIVKAMVESKEITKEEAWEILEELTNMGNTNFKMFLQEISEKLHCQVIKGTLVTRNAIAKKGEKNND